MKDNRTVSRSQHTKRSTRSAEDIADHAARWVYASQVGRTPDAPCASGAHCVAEPAARVAYRGDVCAACRRVRADMAARLRAKR